MANEFLCHEFIVYTKCIRRQDLLGTLNAFGLYLFSGVFIVLSHHDTFGQHKEFSCRTESFLHIQFYQG
jgi:hypothetical protein